VGNLLSISNGLVEHVDWATPNMQVMKFALLPASLSEDICWRETGGMMGNVIDQKDGVLNSHGP
jgi:hypothetical protein